MTERRLYNTDEQLLQGFKENDDRAWSTLLNNKDLRKMIFSLVIKNSGNEEDAIDVLQDALIVLYEKVQLGTFELTSKLTVYIYAVARFIWYKELRRRGKLIIIGDDYKEIPEIDDEYTDELPENIEILREALKKISEQCRNLIMSFYGGEKLKDIMDRLDGYYKTYDSIRIAISKCRIKLKVAYNNVKK